jgi:hypothetical protein
MAVRWTAAGMMEAAKGFRRLKAYKHLPVLRAAPAAHQSELNTRLTPYSIIHGDTCFAYFNKIWGIPCAIACEVFGDRRSGSSCCFLY